MNKWWNNIRYAGIVATDSTIEQQYIRITNEACFFIGILTFFMGTIYFIVSPNLYILVTYIIASSVFFSMIILQYYRKIYTARLILIGFISPLMMLVQVSMGVKMEMELSFLSTTLVIGLLLPKWKYRVPLLIYHLGWYFFTYYYLMYNDPLFEEFAHHWSGLPTFLLVVLSVVLFVHNFSKVSNTAEDSIHESLLLLSESTQQLEENQSIIAQQNQQLEDANQELEKFMYVASHDLKAPLRSISNFTSLIKRKLKDHDNPDIHEYLDFTTKGTIQMQRLIDDILTFSKVGQNITIEAVDLNKVMVNVEYSLRNEIAAKNASIRIEELPTISTDKYLMNLLFSNLIDNAIRYNASPFPIVKITYEDTEKQHIFKIVDNGIGITKEHFDLVFEMFKRLHTQVTYQGSGIGLATCQKIVELMNGKIMLSSTENKGTTFSIHLPKN